MNYQSSEESVYGGSPLEAYLFQTADTAWRYTSADHTLKINGEEYAPAYISRGRTEHGDQAAKADLQLTVARDNPMLTAHVAGLGQPITLTLFRGHGAGGEFVTAWKGRVIAAGFSGSEGTVRCESVFTSIKRQGLRRKYQYLCAHVLYRGGCRLAAATFAVAGTVSEADGTVVTIPGLDAYADGWFVAGYLQMGIFYRTISGHSANQVEIDRPLAGLAPTVAVTVYPGCDHYLDHCADKFGNLDNYGGWPYIPLKNPFSGLGNSLL